MKKGTAALLDKNLYSGVSWELSQGNLSRLEEILRLSNCVPSYARTPIRGCKSLGYNGLKIHFGQKSYILRFGFLSSEDDTIRIAAGLESAILHSAPSEIFTSLKATRVDLLGLLSPEYPKSVVGAPDFEPDEWKGFPRANCFVYALNLKINRSINPIGSIASKCKQGDAGERYKCGLKEFKLIPWDVDMRPSGRGHYIALYLKGMSVYHFTRLDSDGYWSSKNIDSPPTRDTSRGRYITDPYQNPMEKGQRLDSFYFVPDGYALPKSSHNFAT